MSDLVQVRKEGDEYELAFNPRHAYMPVEAGSRTAKIRRHDRELRIVLSEDAFLGLQRAA